MVEEQKDSEVKQVTSTEEPVKEKSPQEEEKESLVMDFSTAFKATTRRGKKKKKAFVQAAASDQPANGTDELEPDALDDVNKDLEDDNLLLADDSLLEVGEIPRNLTITQEQMAARKVMD